MKEATGEVSMTVVTLVAIGVVGAILAIMWPTIKNNINGLWSNSSAKCKTGQYWNGTSCVNLK